MKFIELQKYNTYSVILRQDDNGNPLKIEPFVVACMPNVKDGEIVDWAYGHYFNDLFEAVNYAKTRGSEHYHPNFHRLNEIASKVIDGLIEDDEESAYEYFIGEIEMDEREAKYFGLDVEKFNEQK